MRILSIDLKNIKCHREIHLDFVGGVNVLSGANGVGKSTIFEAVGYALFGVDAKDFVGNISRFITFGEKKGSVSVTFVTDNGEHFQVSRGVGAGSKWQLAASMGDDFEVEEHSGAGETEDRIKELLGLQGGRSLADQFKLVIGPLQHDFLGPFIAKGKKRQELFDEILGVDSWRKTWKETRALATAVKNKIDLLNEGIKAKQEQLVDLKEKKRKRRELERDRKKAEKELRQKQKERKSAKKQLLGLDEKEKEVHQLSSAIKLIQERIETGRTKIETQKHLVKESMAANGVIEQTREAKQGFESCEKRILELRSQERQQHRLEKKATELEKEQARIYQKMNHEKGEIQRVEKQLNGEQQELEKTFKTLVVDPKQTAQAAGFSGLQKAMEELRSNRDMLDGRRSSLLEGKEKLSGGVCPYFKEACLNLSGKSVGDVFGEGLENLENQRDVLSEQLMMTTKQLEEAGRAKEEQNRLETRKQEIQKQLEKLEKRRGENKKRKKNLQQIVQQLGDIEKKIVLHQEKLKVYQGLEEKIAKEEKLRASYQKDRDQYLAHIKAATELKNRQDGLVAMEELLVELQETLQVKQKGISDLRKEYTSENHSVVRKKKEELTADIAACEQKLINISGEYSSIDSDIRRLEKIDKEMKAAVSKLNKVEKQQRLIEFLRKQVFNSVSEHLSERFREEISLRADQIYRTIAETDEELSWGENYQVLLRDRVGNSIRERNDDQLSGGQIMSAVVALRLAMLQTIGSRIAFFDEPTSNLDSTRRENLARAFRAIDVGREELSTHWYDQLFLISHDVAFTEVTDQIITLE